MMVFFQTRLGKILIWQKLSQTLECAFKYLNPTIGHLNRNSLRNTFTDFKELILNETNVPLYLKAN